MAQRKDLRVVTHFLSSVYVYTYTTVNDYDSLRSVQKLLQDTRSASLPFKEASLIAKTWNAIIKKKLIANRRTSSFILVQGGVLA